MDWASDLWEHQRQGCEDVLLAIAAGKRRIVFTSPTGMGKSRCMTEMLRWASSERMESILYTHRRLLLTQTSNVLSDNGIEYGMRAAGFETALLKSVQLAMIQTERVAVLSRKTRPLHKAGLVLTDELHAVGGDTMPELHQQHYMQGAAVVGITATPLDLSWEWDALVVAGRNSDGRKCGALLPAYTYCPDQPDLKHIKNYKVGEDLTDAENHKAIMRPGVFGRVYDNWLQINPERKPTILFGPDVAGSLFFAQEFHKMGVRAAHIDAKQIWYDGEFMESDDENRQRILDMTETGEVEVLCNRFVLREGINLPHIAVAILACVFGSLKTYLQSVGRVLRAHPSLTEVTIIDHGGNFTRHGSPNSDREWFLGQSGYKTTGLRQEMLREKPDMEPIRCPRCGTMRLSGPTCPKCGHACHKRSRPVVQIDGTLKLVEGPSFKPRRRAMKPDTAEKLKSMYYRAKSEKWDASFAQMEAKFFLENYYYPPKDCPFMPINPSDHFEKVRSVPRDRLH